MNLQEFKAWFEGYTESITLSPTRDQWKRIKKRVSEIDGSPTPQTIFVDRYVQPYYPYWNGIYSPHHFCQGGIGAVGSGNLNTDNKHLCLDATANYSAADAFNQLGKIEFEHAKDM